MHCVLDRVTHLLLWPGELALSRIDIAGKDHQATIRMLVNPLVWGLLGDWLGLRFLPVIA